MLKTGVAAFDFDGTLLPRDSFVPFLARARGYRSVGQAFARCGPLLVRSLPASPDRDLIKAALVARLLRDYPADRLAILGEAYGAELAGRLRPSMAGRIRWHRERRHRLVLVSASLEAYLVPLGRCLGFDAVLATALEIGPHGLLTGRLEGANCRGEEKVIRLRSWLAANPDGAAGTELWAYGDSAGDRDLLAMADHPTWVRRRRPLDPLS